MRSRKWKAMLSTLVVMGVSFLSGSIAMAAGNASLTGNSWTDNQVKTLSGPVTNVTMGSTNISNIEVSVNHSIGTNPPGNYLFTTQSIIGGNGVNTAYAPTIEGNDSFTQSGGGAPTGTYYAASDVYVLSGYYVPNPQVFYPSGSNVGLSPIPRPQFTQAPTNLQFVRAKRH